MSSLGVVTDFVSGLHSNPLWNRTVHVHLMGKFTFDYERFVRTHFDEFSRVRYLDLEEKVRRSQRFSERHSK